MREMLDDLRLDLGIPDTDDEDSLGLKSILDFTVEPEINHARRKARSGKHHNPPPISSSNKVLEIFNSCSASRDN